MHTLLISAPELLALRATGAPLMVFDCSFDLMNPSAGEAQYREAHIPGAVYAHLDTALSDKLSRDAVSGGRHPLPSRERFAIWLSSVGMRNDMQAVVYDRQGCNYCGRLWWMLRWCGHAAVAVLDGGFAAWQAAGGAVASGSAAGGGSAAAGASHAPAGTGRFSLRAPLVRLVSTDEVVHALGRPSQTLLDARAPARYRGETEPLDPVAGHIPGALNRPFGSNIGADGRFKPAAQLRAESTVSISTPALESTSCRALSFSCLCEK